MEISEYFLVGRWSVSGIAFTAVRIFQFAASMASHSTDSTHPIDEHTWVVQSRRVLGNSLDSVLTPDGLRFPIMATIQPSHLLPPLSVLPNGVTSSLSVHGSGNNPAQALSLPMARLSRAKCRLRVRLVEYLRMGYAHHNHGPSFCSESAVVSKMDDQSVHISHTSPLWLNCPFLSSNTPCIDASIH